MAKGSKAASAVKRATEAIRDALQVDALSSDENEALVRSAIDILNRDYFDDVRGISADLIRQVKAGEIKDRDGLYEAVHEAVDSSQRVMYTWQARVGLLSTNNLDAYEESVGEPPKDASQQMFSALEADVMAHLDAEGVDDMFEEA